MTATLQAAARGAKVAIGWAGEFEFFCLFKSFINLKTLPIERFFAPPLA